MTGRPDGRPPSAAADLGSVSYDGTAVAFTTTAADIVPAVDVNGTTDVYVRDISAGVSRLVSRDAGGLAASAELGVVVPDGSSVLFQSSAGGLAPGVEDTNRVTDVFAYRMFDGAVSAISTASGGTRTGNGSSRLARWDPDASPVRPSSLDGGVVAFESAATDLVSGISDVNNCSPGSLPPIDSLQGDIYVRSLRTARTTLLTRVPGTDRTGDDGSTAPRTSDDGSKVSFESNATDLVPGLSDWNDHARDVFVADTQTGAIRPVSVDDDKPSSTLYGVSYGNSMSGNGRFVVFDFLYGNGWPLIVRRDLFPPAPVPPAAPAPSPAPSPEPAPARTRTGYRMVTAAGEVHVFGDYGWFGNAATGRASAVDMEATPSHDGYWIVDEGGHVFSFGDAGYHGGAPGLAAGEAVTSLSGTRSGGGYWLFTSKGRVFAYGDAPHLGDMSGIRLNGPVLDSIPTVTGMGYYMVASDGGIFTFGDAEFLGSMGASVLNAPVQSLVPDPDGSDYWLVAADGGIFTFDAIFYGSMGGVRLNRPVTGMVGSANGYLMVAEDDGIFSFGDAPFRGSLGDRPPSSPVAAVSAPR